MPSNPLDSALGLCVICVRLWAHVLVERCEALFGAEHCKAALSHQRKAFTLFSGIECARASWNMIAKAAELRWGITVGLEWSFAVSRASVTLRFCFVWLVATLGPKHLCLYHELSVPKVEIDKKCQDWILNMYPDSCLFSDMFDLIKNEVPEHELLEVSKVKFTKSAWCLAHEQECPVHIDDTMLCVLGMPCVLFSRSHVLMSTGFSSWDSYI